MKMNFKKKAPIFCAALSIALISGCACNMEEPAPVAEPEPAPVAAAAAPVAPSTESFSVNTAELFDFDKATLRPEGLASLDAAIAKYRGNAELQSMTVVGHTDSVGSDAYNQALSERRANAVREYLVSQNIDGSKISASGMGESSPAASNDTADGRQKNRRVEITATMQRQVTR